VFKFALLVGGLARCVESVNPLPSPHGGVSLAEFQGGGKCLIEGWSDV